MDKFKRLLLIFGCLLLLSAAKPSSYKITGIKGDLLINVQHRLTELYTSKPIAQEQPDALNTQIEKALSPYGYFKPQISIHNHGTGKTLGIHIAPGPQMLITSLEVRIIGDGIDNMEIREAIHFLPIKAGQPLNTPLYEEAKDNLFSSAEHQGYLHATFEKSEILIDRKHYTARITLIFNTGPQYYFGQLRFDPTYISPELLARYVPFKPGEPYSTDQVLALNTNLSASGYFKSVVVKPQIKDKYTDIRDVPVFIHMQPADRVSYSMGVGYGTDTGPRGRAGLQIAPLNHAGHKFNAIAQGSFKENALLAQYIIPGQNPVTDNYSINGNLSNLNYSSGYSNSLLLSLAQQHALTNYQRILSLNTLVERYNYTDEPKTTKKVFFPKASFTWRNVTDQLFSPSGYNVNLTGLAASKMLLSDINLAQASIDMKAAVTVDPIRTRFFFHAIGGTSQMNDINNLPLSLALLLGGAENLKAYSYNSIGPGKVLSFGSLEVQKETIDKWYFIGFIDSGDVSQPSPKLFKYDAGIGLMWVSPVGPIKVGVAQAVDNRFHRLERRYPKLVINMGPDL